MKFKNIKILLREKSIYYGVNYVYIHLKRKSKKKYKIIYRKIVKWFKFKDVKKINLLINNYLLNNFIFVFLLLWTFLPFFILYYFNEMVEIIYIVLAGINNHFNNNYSIIINLIKYRIQIVNLAYVIITTYIIIVIFYYYIFKNKWFLSINENLGLLFRFYLFYFLILTYNLAREFSIPF